MTDAEKDLWRMLRESFPEQHFRRQVPIRHFIADFASHRAKLVVEVDGGQHNEEADADRTLIIEAEGYRVIRFWNNDLRQNASGVLDTVYAALYGSRDAEPFALKHKRRQRRHPTPARFARRPSPSRGG